MNSANNLLRLQANRNAPDGVSGNVIKNCSIVTVGEALGHGVFLDESFVQECYEQASELKMGLKARFGHPGMCNEALGTYLGRFKNFSISKDGKQLYGDMHLSKSAENTPHGNIAGYVKQLAQDDPESFGTSIVFQIGSYYRKDENGDEVDVDMYGETEEYPEYNGDPDALSEELYVRCDKLMGCDFVDEPAANPSGLFSAASIAGEIEYFFSQHPEVKELLSTNENVVDIIEKYGVNIKQYLQVKDMESNEKEFEDTELNVNSDSVAESAEVEELQEEEAVELEPATEEVVEEVAEVEEAEEADEAEEDEVEPDVAEEASMSVTQFRAMVEEFGSGIAGAVFDSKGTRENALDMYVAKLSSEKKALSEEVDALKAKLNELETQIDQFSSDGVSFESVTPVKKRDIARNVKL